MNTKTKRRALCTNFTESFVTLGYLRNNCNKQTRLDIHRPDFL